MNSTEMGFRRSSLAVAALCVLSLTPAVLADTYYVRAGGSDTADGGTPQTAFRTVLHAAGAINHGDSLVIGPGTFQGSALMAERFSADGATMAITGDESGQLTGDPAGAVVLVASRPAEAALTLYRFRNLSLSGLTFRGPGQGLKLDKCIGVTVQRCTFDGLARAVLIGACQDTRVQSCVLSRNILGLFIQGSARTRVEHVTLSGSTSAGLLALSCGAGEIRNCLLAANNSNLVLDPLSAQSWTSDYNVLSGTTSPWGDVPAVAKIHEWTSASGQDRHSVCVVPAFAGADRHDLHISDNVTWPGGLPGMNTAVASGHAVLDRDGKAFRVRGAATCAGAYDYPDPRPAAGWAKLSVNLDGREPRQSAGIYRENGELIRTLLADAAGVTELYWDGLDDKNNPVFDFEKAARFGPMKDPSARGMSCIRALSVAPGDDAIYYGAVTRLYNKMVPAWGADGTGVGKSAADGTPLWFALSSGGNYMSVSAMSDGRHTFVLAGKSFGGQIDLFDEDGLRLTTGNWSWPCNYSIGFVDLRYGVNAYLRPDGKVGAYVEDDSIGRFARCRIDGAETIRKTCTPLDWRPTGAAAGEPPDTDRVRAKGLETVQVIPKVAALKPDGDWRAWEKAGIAPQIIALPTVSFRHCTLPDDLWQTFSLGTAIGALAHDGKCLYACFLVCDQPQRFNAETPATMFSTDSVELWVEQDQFGLGFIQDGSAHLFKYRFHDRQGKQYAANYPLADENVWGRKLDDVSAHPLGRQLAEITGVPLHGRKGYVVMGRIPMEEIKLVGGVAGRGGTDILNMTGQGGEVIRIAVAFSGNVAWGHSQDYKVAWPAGMMFSDPTRSSAFVLGE